MKLIVNIKEQLCSIDYYNQNMYHFQQMNVYNWQVPDQPINAMAAKN